MESTPGLPKINTGTVASSRRYTSEAAMASLAFGILVWVGAPVAVLLSVVAGSTMSLVAAVLGLGCGWIALKQIRKAQWIRGRQAAIVGSLLSGPLPVLTLAVTVPITLHVRERRDQGLSRSNLLSVGIAAKDWFNMRAPSEPDFPPASAPVNGSSTRISWRYFILRGLGDYTYVTLQDSLEYREDKSFASRYAKLVDSMPREYRSPNQQGPAHQTVYLAVTSDASDPKNPYPTVFNHHDHPIRFHDVPDGLANTAMIVEADDDQAVVWTEPKDWLYDPSNPKRGLGKMRRGNVMTLMADGSVRLISTNVDEQVLREYFQRNDHQAPASGR